MGEISSACMCLCVRAGKEETKQKLSSTSLACALNIMVLVGMMKWWAFQFNEINTATQKEYAQMQEQMSKLANNGK